MIFAIAVEPCGRPMASMRALALGLLALQLLALQLLAAPRPSIIFCLVD
eukprot:COSAG06_NODE_38949_length_417_cov_38.025157_1_plen_48_part_10